MDVGFQHDRMKRTSMNKCCRIVARVMKTLPKEFRPFLDNVVIDVEEEPDLRTLRKAGFTEEEIAAGDSLFGLFDPLELPSALAADVVDTNDMLHRLVIFKAPLEEEFRDPHYEVPLPKYLDHESWKEIRLLF